MGGTPGKEGGRGKAVSARRGQRPLSLSLWPHRSPLSRDAAPLPRRHAKHDSRSPDPCLADAPRGPAHAGQCPHGSGQRHEGQPVAGTPDPHNRPWRHHMARVRSRARHASPPPGVHVRTVGVGKWGPRLRSHRSRRSCHRLEKQRKPCETALARVPAVTTAPPRGPEVAQQRKQDSEPQAPPNYFFFFFPTTSSFGWDEGSFFSATSSPVPSSL